MAQNQENPDKKMPPKFSDQASDAYYMSLALKEAKESGQDVPVGSILVRNLNIIGRGHNQRESTADPTGHAEIIALREAASKTGTWRLAGCTLYSTLEPCPMCAEAIIQSRVSRLVFGAYDTISGAVGSAFNLFVPRSGYPLPEAVGGICEEECRNLLVEHFKKRR